MSCCSFTPTVLLPFPLVRRVPTDTGTLALHLAAKDERLPLLTEYLAIRAASPALAWV